MESFLSNQMRILFWQLRKELEDSLITYNVFKEKIFSKLNYENVEKLLLVLIKLKYKDLFVVKGDKFEKINVPFVSENDAILVKVREVWERKVDDDFSIKRYQNSLKEKIKNELAQKADLIKKILEADWVVVYIFKNNGVDDVGRKFNVYQPVILS